MLASVLLSARDALLTTLFVHVEPLVEAGVLLVEVEVGVRGHGADAGLLEELRKEE